MKKTLILTAVILVTVCLVRADELILKRKGKEADVVITGIDGKHLTYINKAGKAENILLSNVSSAAFSEGKQVLVELKSIRDTKTIKGTAKSIAGGRFVMVDEGGNTVRKAIMQIEGITFPGSREPVRVIKNGGGSADLKDILVPGKITIVDFFAEWCGPCRAAGPVLEEMAKTDPDVYLTKVDIDRWGTPVCEQYAIRSVPNIRVFGREGKQVGTTTSSPVAVKQMVEQAKK